MPMDIGNHLEVISFLIQIQRPRQALEHIERLLGQAPDSVELHIKRSLALSGIGDAEGAAQAARHALALEPSSVQALYLLASFALEANRPDEALAFAEEALRQEPSASLCFALRARVYAQIGRRKDAECDLESAIRADPENTENVLSLLQLQDWRSDPGLVRVRLRKLLSANPTDAKILFNLACIAVEEYDLAEARTCLREVLKLQPQYPKAEQALRALELVPQQTQDEKPRLGEMQRGLNAWVRATFGHRKAGTPTLAELGMVLKRHAEFLEHLPDGEALNWQRLSFAGTRFEFIAQALTHPQGQAMFRGYTLDAFDLEETDLRWSNLSAATFERSRFERCKFALSIGVDSMFSSNKWHACDLTSVDFSDSQFHQEQFIECAMKSVDFERNVMHNVVFERCDLSYSRWPKVACTRCTFKQCVMTGAVLREATLQHCEFIECTFDGVQDADIQLSDCVFTGCALS